MPKRKRKGEPNKERECRMVSHTIFSSKDKKEKRKWRELTTDSEKEREFLDFNPTIISYSSSLLLTSQERREIPRARDEVKPEVSNKG